MTTTSTTPTFTTEVKDIISLSRQAAIDNGNDYIGVAHLLLGILAHPNSIFATLLHALPINLNELRTAIAPAKGSANVGDAPIPLTKHAEMALKGTYIVSKELNRHTIDDSILILSIIKHDDGHVRDALSIRGLTYTSVKEMILNAK